MTDQPQGAYDPDTTPDTFGMGVGQTWAHPKDAPLSPTPQGEVLLDENGERREIAPRDDGRPVQLNIDKEA